VSLLVRSDGDSVVGSVAPPVKPILAANNFLIVVAKLTSGDIAAPRQRLLS
jgi:hypothetical protein